MKKMIYKRYITFLNSIKNKCTKSSAKFLLSISKEDVRLYTGANIRHIYADTGVKIIQGLTSAAQLINHVFYQVLEGEEWRYPFLCSLLMIRDSEWEILFNDENEVLDDNDVTHMNHDICIS